MTKRFKIEPDFTCPELAGYKLPPVEPDGFGQPLTDYIKEKHNQAECIGFIDGYTKAREKFEFTESQLRQALSMAFIAIQDGGNITSDEIISSLRTPRTPIAIEVEMVEVFKDEYNHFSASTQLLIGKDIRKTTRPAINPDGTVKGVYIYE